MRRERHKNFFVEIDMWKSITEIREAEINWVEWLCGNNYKRALL